MLKMSVWCAKKRNDRQTRSRASTKTDRLFFRNGISGTNTATPVQLYVSTGTLWLHSTCSMLVVLYLYSTSTVPVRVLIFETVHTCILYTSTGTCIGLYQHRYFICSGTVPYRVRVLAPVYRPAYIPVTVLYLYYCTNGHSLQYLRQYNVQCTSTGTVYGYNVL